MERVPCVRGCDIAGHGDHRRPFVDNGSQNRRRKYGARLFRIYNAPDVEARGIEELVRVQLFQGGRIHDSRLDISGYGDDRSPFLACVHQSIEEVRYARARGSTYDHWVTAKIGIRHCGEDTIFFVTDVDKLNFSIAPQRVNHWIQRVSDDTVAAFYAGARQHFPHDVGNFL